MNDDDLLHLTTLSLAESGQEPLHSYRVVVRGEIEMASAPKLAGVLDGLIEDGATMIVLDASQVEFLDSTGLRVVIAAGNRLAGNGGRLFIEGMSGAVQRVLEVSGLIEQYRR